MKAKRILIGTPHGRHNFTPEYVVSLVALVKKPMKGYVFDYLPLENLYIHKNRNEIAMFAVAKNYDYLLFIDTDMFFLREDVAKLLELKAQVVGGVYPRRMYPYCPTCWNFNKESGKGSFDYMIPRDKPFECDGVATGFLLINVKVLKKLYKEYVNPFAYGEESKGKDLDLGEDVWFMKRLNDIGIRAIARPDLQIQHVGNTMIGLNLLNGARVSVVHESDSEEETPLAVAH